MLASACFAIRAQPLPRTQPGSAPRSNWRWAGRAASAPLHARYRVEALGDGQFTGTGPFYLGCRMALGPMARLSLGGIQILVSSYKQQAADQAMFRHLGIEPRRQRILVLKSSVHFRADFGPIARGMLIVAASGENIADLGALRYCKLRPGVVIDPSCAAPISR